MAQAASELRLGEVYPQLNYKFIEQTLQPGPSVSLKCSASGNPTPQISWALDGFRLPQNERFMIGQYVTLFGDVISHVNISSVKSDDSGEYECIAENRAGKAAHRARLNIYGLPYVRPMSPIPAIAGKQLVIKCPVAGYPIENVYWEKDGIRLPTNIRQRVTNSTLILENVQKDGDQGSYTCVARNKQNNTSQQSVDVQVLVPPRWVLEPSDQSVVLGNSVLLTCQVDGFPKPKVVWKQAIGNEPGEYREIGYHSEHIRSLENGSLIIPRVSEEHEGYYLCQAMNGIGAGLSKVVHLIVHAGPHFKTESHQETVRKGDLVHLHCEAEGDVPMDVTWKAKGHRIQPGYDIRYMIKNTPFSNGILSELNILDASHLDRGDYTCTASNAYGQDHVSIQLLVQEPPDFPRNLHIAEQTSHSMRLAWSPSAGDTLVTSYILQYKESRDVWHEHNPQKIVSGDKTDTLISDLRPATSYHFRLYAENQLGTSTPSDVLHGTTNGDAPAGPPRQVSAEPVGSQALHITWQPPERDLWNGELLGYNIGYRKAGSEHYNFTRVAVTSDLTGDFRLAGLGKFTKYNVIVQAFNAKGDGPSSDPVMAETQEDVPSAPPRDIECTALSFQNLEIKWKPPPDHLIHGIIQGYKLSYEPLEERYDPVIPDTKVTTATSTVLHGLQPFTNYSFQVLAFTRVGNGVPSNIVYCMTEQTVPEAPEKIKTVIASSDAVIISWLSPRHPNGILTKYTVYIRVLEHGEEKKIMKATLPSYQHFYKADGLKRREKYEAWVTASTKIGQGLSTPIIQLSPNAVVPAAIVSFGQIFIVPWKMDLKLPCVCIGIPKPVIEWKLGDLKLNYQPRFQVSSENTLTIENVQRSNEGNYSCHARNNLGSDSIVYSLQVQVPPTPPLLLATAVTLTSVQLQWKQGDNGGAPVKGFLLSYRQDHGDWEEVSIDRRATTYLLDGLSCGSRYQFRLTAFNKIGSGTPSKLETAVTKGGKPKEPPINIFLQVNHTSVTLFLSAWQDGGCPILYFVIEYKKENSDWTLVSNNVLLQPKFPIIDMIPSTLYTLRVTAHNNAGSTQSEYKFVTQSAGGETSPEVNEPDNSKEAPFYQEYYIAIVSIFSLVAVLLAVTGVCYCLRKKPLQEDITLHEFQTTAVLDNKQNTEQREQYYTTVRKPLQTPMHDMNCLERIPEYSEDIYPYATFHLPEQENMSSNPQLRQSFGYEHRTSEPLPVQQGEVDHYSKVRRRQRRKSKSFKSESEEYDTHGSDSDTEQGTSRTESSNHLDDSVTEVCPPSNRTGLGIHEPIHHNFLYHPQESRTSGLSPVSERKSFPRNIQFRPSYASHSHIRTSGLHGLSNPMSNGGLPDPFHRSRERWVAAASEQSAGSFRQWHSNCA